MVPMWMSLSEVAEACFELIKCKFKNVCRRWNVLMQTYIALYYANVHVKNSYRIWIIIEELFLKFWFDGPHYKTILFHIYRIRFYHLCLLLWHHFFKNQVSYCPKDTKPCSNFSLHLILNRCLKKRLLLFLKM